MVHCSRGTTKSVSFATFNTNINHHSIGLRFTVKIRTTHVIDNVFGSIPFCWSPIFIFALGLHADDVITMFVHVYTPVMPPIAKHLEPTFNYISHRCTGTWNLKHSFRSHRHRNFNGVWRLTFLTACSVAEEIMLL